MFNFNKFPWEDEDTPDELCDSSSPSSGDEHEPNIGIPQGEVYKKRFQEIQNHTTELDRMVLKFSEHSLITETKNEDSSSDEDYADEWFVDDSFQEEDLSNFFKTRKLDIEKGHFTNRSKKPISERTKPQRERFYSTSFRNPRQTIIENKNESEDIDFIGDQFSPYALRQHINLCSWSPGMNKITVAPDQFSFDDQQKIRMRLMGERAETIRISFVFQFSPMKFKAIRPVQEVLEVFTNNFNKQTEQIISGCLIYFDKYGINMFEGNEASMLQFLHKFLSLPLDDLFIAIKMVFKTAWTERFFKQYFHVTTPFPSTFGCEKFPEPKLHGVKETWSIINESIGQLHRFWKLVHQQNLVKNCQELPEDLIPFIPSPRLIDFMLASPVTRDLYEFWQSITDMPTAETNFDDLWPPPTDFVPSDPSTTSRAEDELGSSLDQSHFESILPDPLKFTNPKWGLPSRYSTRLSLNKLFPQTLPPSDELELKSKIEEHFRLFKDLNFLKNEIEQMGGLDTKETSTKTSSKPKHSGKETKRLTFGTKGNELYN